MQDLTDLSWDRWPRLLLEAAALFVFATIVFDAIHFTLHRCLNSRWSWLRKLTSPHQAHHDLRNYLNTATRPGACSLCDTITTHRPVGLIPGS
jgi:hypothetical protein